MKRFIGLLLLMFFGLTGATLAAVPATTGPIGVFKLQADGTYAYQSDVYRVAFDRNGVMVSLVVKGQEFLRPVKGEIGGAGFFVNGKRIPLPTTSASPTWAMIADGTNAIFLTPTPDRLDLDLGQEVAAAQVEYVYFPADGIQVTPVENPVFRGQRLNTWEIVGKTAQRWTAPNGTAIELHYDTKLTKNYGGVLSMPVDLPYKTRTCGEIRFPATTWTTAKVNVDWQGAVEDHNFLKDAPISLSGSANWQGNELPKEPMKLVLQVEDMNTLLPVASFEQPLTWDKATVPFTWKVDWDKPGPWRVHVMVVSGNHVVGVHSGVVVYDLNDYKPPLHCPKDFWQFWEKALADQRTFPLDAVLEKDEAASTKDYTIYKVYITGYLGRRLEGSYGEPVADGRFPVTLGGGHSGANVTAPKDAATCNLMSPMDGMATYRTGLSNRYTSNLFYNYIDALRWVDFLASRPKVDLNRSIYYAGSRSGPVGIALLALDPRVKMYIANVPTNNRWDWQVTLPGANAWGPWASDRTPGQSLDDFTNELSYFNADNFAERVTQPVLIGFGLTDGLAQVTGSLACYARLASPKKKICLRAWYGHSDANKDWYDTSAQWRKELFGE